MKRTTSWSNRLASASFPRTVSAGETLQLESRSPGKLSFTRHACEMLHAHSPAGPRYERSPHLSQPGGSVPPFCGGGASLRMLSVTAGGSIDSRACFIDLNLRSVGDTYVQSTCGGGGGGAVAVLHSSVPS